MWTCRCFLPGVVNSFTVRGGTRDSVAALFGLDRAEPRRWQLGSAPGSGRYFAERKAGWRESPGTVQAETVASTYEYDAAQHEAAALIRKVVEDWALFRDAGLWEQFAAVWHDDGW